MTTCGLRQVYSTAGCFNCRGEATLCAELLLPLLPQGKQQPCLITTEAGKAGPQGLERWQQLATGVTYQLTAAAAATLAALSCKLQDQAPWTPGVDGGARGPGLKPAHTPRYMPFPMGLMKAKTGHQHAASATVAPCSCALQMLHYAGAIHRVCMLFQRRGAATCISMPCMPLCAAVLCVLLSRSTNRPHVFTVC